MITATASSEISRIGRRRSYTSKRENRLRSSLFRCLASQKAAGGRLLRLLEIAGFEPVTSCLGAGALPAELYPQEKPLYKRQGLIYYQSCKKSILSPCFCAVEVSSAPGSAFSGRFPAVSVTISAVRTGAAAYALHPARTVTKQFNRRSCQRFCCDQLSVASSPVRVKVKDLRASSSAARYSS